MRIDAAFVTSAVIARDFPEDGLPEVALVGRSNVGKSSLINALVRQRLARTSAAPGKTRLANVYRLAHGSAGPIYVVDLPGYGYARGEAASSPRKGLEGSEAKPSRRARASDSHEPLRSAKALSNRAGGGTPGQVDERGAPRALENGGGTFAALTEAYFARKWAPISALLLVDSRHPGLASDLDAWQWIRSTVGDAAVIATKIDKLARGERIRAMRELESVFDHSVLPVSAVTGEGLDELWKLIDRLTNSRNRNRRSSPSNPPGATAPPTKPLRRK